MARNADIRYIRFYTDGTAAKKIAPAAPVAGKPHTAPRKRANKRVPLHIDPVAVFGIVVSLVMLVCILVGMSSLESAQAEVVQMEERVAALKAENAQLKADYEDGYDLDSIRIQALEMGMVPASQVSHVRISVTPKQSQSQGNSMTNLLTTLTDLFA